MKSTKDSLDLSVDDKNVPSLLDTNLYTAAHIRMVNFMPCTFSKPNYLLFLYIILKLRTSRHVLAVLSLLCLVYMEITGF